MGAESITGCSALGAQLIQCDCEACKIGNLFRSLPGAWGSVILGALSGDGLARESAAVAPGGGVLAHERPAARPLLAGEDVAQERSALPEVALPSSPDRPGGKEGNPASDDVMITVDPHKASNTAAVLDPVTKTLIETARFANSDEGYGR